MLDWLEICIPLGLIILGCIAVFLIKKIASYRADRLEEEQVQLLVDMADTFQERAYESPLFLLVSHWW